MNLSGGEGSSGRDMGVANGKLHLKELVTVLLLSLCPAGVMYLPNYKYRSQILNATLDSREVRL